MTSGSWLLRRSAGGMRAARSAARRSTLSASCSRFAAPSAQTRTLASSHRCPKRSRASPLLERCSVFRMISASRSEVDCERKAIEWCCGTEDVAVESDMESASQTRLSPFMPLRLQGVAPSTLRGGGSPEQ